METSKVNLISGWVVPVSGFRPGWNSPKYFLFVYGRIWNRKCHVFLYLNVNLIFVILFLWIINFCRFALCLLDNREIGKTCLGKVQGDVKLPPCRCKGRYFMNRWIRTDSPEKEKTTDFCNFYQPIWADTRYQVLNEMRVEPEWLFH